jgi:hypothetical protein
MTRNLCITRCFLQDARRQTREGLAAAVAGIGAVGSAAVLTVIGSLMRQR